MAGIKRKAPPQIRRPGRTRDDPRDRSRGHGRKKPPSGDGTEKTIVVRDRRKPNQYTTDNVIAREWLPILRVGDAFFFYSVYLSMANRETESSWGSLRTQAEYLQCGVDLIIRGNKLLEICELIHIETGNQRTSNEYYILDPPALTPALKDRIDRRLDAIAAQETSVNWQSWVKQVRKALDRHRSLPSIWAERRNRRGGRPVKTVRAEHTPRRANGGTQPGDERYADNRARESQAGYSADTDRVRGGVRETQAAYREQADRDSQPGQAWLTTAARVSHNQAARDSQPKQEQRTRDLEQDKERKEISLLARAGCQQHGVTPAVIDLLLETHTPEQILQQLEWLPFRQPRDPAAMLVSAIQGDWAAPAGFVPGEDVGQRVAWEGDRPRDGEPEDAVSTTSPRSNGDGYKLPGSDVDLCQAWAQVLVEMQFQMTRAAFARWLGGTQVLEVHESTVTVGVRDRYAAEWLATRWIVPIQRTLGEIVGRPVDVMFCAGDDLDGLESSPERAELQLEEELR